MADYLEADCFAVWVSARKRTADSRKVQEIIEKHLNFARNLHIETRVLESDNVAANHGLRSPQSDHANPRDPPEDSALGPPSKH